VVLGGYPCERAHVGEGTCARGHATCACARACVLARAATGVAGERDSVSQQPA
jgi:hypothetical protein